MPSIVSEDPLVYFENRPLPGVGPVLDALQLACEETFHRSPHDQKSPDAFEAVKLLNVVKAQILFYQHLGVYGKVVRGDSEFYEKVCIAITSAQDTLQMMDPDTYNQAVSEAFALREKTMRDEQERARPKEATEGPSTNSRSRQITPTKAPVTLEVFAKARLLARTGAPEDDAFNYREPLQEFDYVPDLETIRAQFRYMLEMSRLRRGGYAASVVVLGYALLVFGRSGNIPSIVSAGFRYLRSMVPWIVQNVLGIETRAAATASANFLRDVFRSLQDAAAYESEIVRYPLETSGNTMSFLVALINHWRGAPPASRAQRVWESSVGDPRYEVNRRARTLMRHPDWRSAIQVAQRVIGWAGTIYDLVAAVLGPIAPYGLSLAGALIAVVLYDYHKFFRPNVREAFLRRHDRGDDRTWERELKERLVLLQDYVNAYYRSFPEYSARMLRDILGLRQEVENTTAQRQRERERRPDDKKKQLEYQNAFIKKMKELAKKIEEMPHDWTEAETLAPRLSDVALNTLRLLGFEHGGDRQLVSHYRNVAVWRHNVGKPRNQQLRPLFEPQRPVGNDAEDSDSDDDDFDPDSESSDKDDDDGDEGLMAVDADELVGLNSDMYGPPRAAEDRDEEHGAEESEGEDGDDDAADLFGGDQSNVPPAGGGSSSSGLFNREGSRARLEMQRMSGPPLARPPTSPESPSRAPPRKKKKQQKRMLSVDCSVVDSVFARLQL